MGIPWGKVGRIAIGIGSTAASFTGLGWLGLAVKGGTVLGGLFSGDESASGAGLKAFEALVEFASDMEDNPNLNNSGRAMMLNNKIRDFAGNAAIKDRHVGLLAMVTLAAARGELSIEEASALLNVDD